jgi:hypothetical protein
VSAESVRHKLWQADEGRSESKDPKENVDRVLRGAQEASRAFAIAVLEHMGQLLERTHEQKSQRPPKQIFMREALEDARNSRLQRRAHSGDEEEGPAQTIHVCEAQTAGGALSVPDGGDGILPATGTSPFHRQDLQNATSFVLQFRAMRGRNVV